MPDGGVRKALREAPAALAPFFPVSGIRARGSGSRHERLHRSPNGGGEHLPCLTGSPAVRRVGLGGQGHPRNPTPRSDA